LFCFQGTSVLSPAFPIGFLIFCAYRFWMNSKTAIFEHHPVLFVMAYGMSASKLSNKLVVSRLVLDSCWIYCLVSLTV